MNKRLIPNSAKLFFDGLNARGIAVEIPQQALEKLCGANVSGGARNCNGKPGAEVANASAARAPIFIKSKSFSSKFNLFYFNFI